MRREIVKIDEGKCTGCGLCVPNCHEGALRIIDNKAVLISDLLCDGLGACIGHCPEGAITIESREAEVYNELKVMAEMLPKGKNVIVAHLKHLKDHNELGYLQQGYNFLLSAQLPSGLNANEIIELVDDKKNSMENHSHQGGCPGSQAINLKPAVSNNQSAGQMSELAQWPIQLHLINPEAGYFKKADLLVAADCTAFAYGNFHAGFLKDKKLVIACPKLDANKDIYVEKIRALIDMSAINTITVIIMEVPCCGGLKQIVETASAKATRKVPVKAIVIGLKGEIIDEQWV